MKYISFAIPCYNSQAYMEKAIQSILPAGEDVEILLINDGSTDGTQQIMEQYEKRYPQIVRAIQKENGGHGDAVNVGIDRAIGRYFKVVDSDDWLDKESLMKMLSIIKAFVDQEREPDMIISNYVYEKIGSSHKKVIHYRNVLPQDQIFHWGDIGRFHLDQYILMHSVIYRTQLLKLCHLRLPRHTFYVDNIYVYNPLPYVRTLYYANLNLYRYFIGREDQSVNEKVMTARLDQQIFVTRSMIDRYELRRIASRKLRRYMARYLAIMMTISSILCLRSQNDENLAKKKDLWRYLKRKDYRTYLKIRYGILGQIINLPGKSGRRVSLLAYRVAQKWIGFN